MTRIKRRAVGVASLTALLSAIALALTAAPAFAATTVSTGVHTEVTRTCQWTIDKTADQSTVSLQVGQTATVQYTITVDRTCSTTGWRAFDGILVESPGAPTTVEGVTSVVTQGSTTTAATVTCPTSFPVTIPPGGSLYCRYSATLSSGAAGSSTATVMTSGGGTVTSAPAPFDFTNPVTTTTTTPRCVEVDDAHTGVLDVLCDTDPVPAVYTYSRTIGPFSTCGTFTVPNHAVLEIWPKTHGDVVLVGDAHDVTVNVPCGVNCTRTIGYWKTHAGFGPQADVVSALLPIWLGTAGGTKSVLVDSAAEAVQYLSMNGAASNGINKLYAQLLAAKLNIASGASGSAVSSVIAAADAFLAQYDSASWSTLSKAQKQQVLSWMTTLDNYNNGLIGPAHCD